MKKERKEKHFINKPEYPGGPRAMHQYIYSHLRYPKEALENKITGHVRVRITIDYQGKVIGTKVIHHLGYGCDEEAERVLRILTFHVPKNRGVKVQFFKTLRVRFKPKEVTSTQPPPRQQVQIKYQLTQSKPEEDGYSYTINL